MMDGFTDLTLTPDIDAAPWRDLKETMDPGQRKMWDAGNEVAMAVVTRVGLMRHGTGKGRATVAIVVRLPDGRTVVAETTLRLARTAALALAQSPVYQEEVFD